MEPSLVEVVLVPSRVKPGWRSCVARLAASKKKKYNWEKRAGWWGDRRLRCKRDKDRDPRSHTRCDYLCSCLRWTLRSGGSDWHYSALGLAQPRQICASVGWSRNPHKPISTYFTLLHDNSDNCRPWPVQVQSRWPTTDCNTWVLQENSDWKIIDLTLLDFQRRRNPYVSKFPQRPFPRTTMIYTMILVAEWRSPFRTSYWRTFLLSIGTTRGPTRFASSRPPAASSVTFTWRRRVLLPSAVTAASSSPVWVLPRRS